MNFSDETKHKLVLAIEELGVSDYLAPILAAIDAALKGSE